MIHALTVDVEDYHNVIGRDWLGRDGPPTRAVVDNTNRLLDQFARHNARATFFTLGEVAATYPELIRRMMDEGHELGVHGYYHRQLFKLNPDSFRREIADAKKIIEDITGRPVEGHRAPAFSIMPNTQWGFEILADEGFRYDSSVFPIRGRRYGWPGFRLDIHEITLPSGRCLIEAPLSIVRLFGRRLPACGGGYLRHFPGLVTHWAIRQIERNRPAIIYTHPYEIEMGVGPLDTDHLEPAAARRTKRFHRLQLRNRATVEPKIVRLLQRFRFAPLREIIEQVLTPNSSPIAMAGRR